jgi:hypothetical protein
MSALTELLTHFETRWKEVGSAPARNLLRLALLRELSFQIHSLRSGVLAGKTSSPKIEVPEIVAAESQLMERANSLSKPSPDFTNLPEGISIEKLTRQDRQWERRILYLALNSGWELAEVRASLPISDIDAIHSDFEKQLWPQAIILFTEGELKPAGFNANWFIVVDPAGADGIRILQLLSRFSSKKPTFTLLKKGKAS